MENDIPGWTLAELAELLGGTLNGPADLRILRLGLSHSADPDSITFAENERFLAQAEASGAGAVLVPRGTKINKPSIEVDRPRIAFFQLLHRVNTPLPLEPGIHPTAVVHPTAEVDPSASIGPYTVVEQGVRVGAKSRIFPFCYIGERCTIGAGVTVYPHATLYCRVTLGDRSIVNAGTVLGADGFSFVWDGSKQVKVPQVGDVKIGDDVEIGALSAVDRAMAGETVLGNGTKIDNFVQIAHNVRIGEHTVIASQTGLSGSAVIGDRVTIAGQTGVNHDTSVANDVILGGRTGVTSDLDEAGAYWGTPARPLRDAQKSALLVTKLPELLQRIKQLERRVAELEKPEE